MEGEIASDAPWDEDEDGEYVDAGEDSVLDSLNAYAPTEDARVGDAIWIALEPTGDTRDQDEDVPTVLFTATNPAGTVSVTALMSGQVLRVELTHHVGQMLESELADEITVISTLARRQAQAGQHVVVALLMRKLGHDQASTRSYLERELGLPSPNTVNSERSSIFATRYADS